jgi:HAMP domain-containing protein
MLLSDYAKKDLLVYKPEQEQLFDSAGHMGQATQQRLLTDNAQNTWQLYHRVQDQILQYMHNNKYQDAVSLNNLQGETAFNNVSNALDQLVQFDGRLITYVQDATNIQERDELITTAIAMALIILCIGIIGALTYGTLVNRLRQLNKVARAVQRGKTDMRAIVDGRDEITDVSTSVNTMLDTIVGLLDETRVQRDAIVSAAERLFFDMHLNNGSKFVDIKTAVNNDPIWMLSHAFNFAIGRFRRSVLRDQTTIKQLDIVSRQWLENVNTFLSNTRRLLRNVPSSQLSSGTCTGITTSLLQEHVRLTEGFAREATEFTQSLRRIIEEMRANLVPFRPNMSQSNQQSHSARGMRSHGNSQRSGLQPRATTHSEGAEKKSRI